MRLRLVLSGLLVSALSACGSQTTPPAVTLKAVDLVRSARDTTAKAGSARIGMTVEGSGMAMTASGVFAMDGKRGSLTMRTTVAGQSVEMEMRTVGDVVYLKMPPELGAPTPWMSVDLKRAAATNDLAALSQMQANDPTQSLAYLQGIADDVRETGKETLRGAETTRYEGTVDFAKAGELQSDPRVRQAIANIAEQLGGQTAPVTVWIDTDGLVRKLVQSFDLSKADGGDSLGTMTSTIELYDFGAPVEVSAPPKRQVTDGTALLGGGRQ